VHKRIDAFDRAYSRFRDDSLVGALAREGGSVRFPDDLPPLYEVYAALHDATGGVMTPLVGASLEQLGYGRDYRLTPAGPALASPRFDRVEIDGTTLTVDAPALIDFGAAGKGYLVDLVADELANLGIVEFTIDASGDLLHTAEPPLRVALEHPYDSTKAIGIAEISGGAICGSAANRRAWGNGLHHVLDGLTGEPVRETVATWVTAATALHADAVATALFFEDAETIADATGWRFEAVRMSTDGRVEVTSGFPGELFTR